MTSTIVHLVAGARPNFVKIAPLWHVLDGCGWCIPRIVHTGQHDDIRMSDWMFRDLNLPAPHFHLECRTGSHAQTTGTVMMAYEALCRYNRPIWSIVVGDVDSTIACALAAKKLGIAVAHLEAGLRSFDRTMPEEINRILTDSIADLLWTPSPDADENLRLQGVPEERIERVGNIMIDALVGVEKRLGEVDVKAIIGTAFAGPFAVMTLHRPSNVDSRDALAAIMQVIVEVSKQIPVVFPVHPRTCQRLKEFDLLGSLSDAGVQIIDPLGYIEFIALVRRAQLLVTDSGGVQEETTWLGIPCLTLRPTTERPITVTLGTNRMTTPGKLCEDIADVLRRGDKRARPVVPLWDGATAGRVAQSLHRAIDWSASV